MIAPLATIGPTAYWYLARGTGAVALVLLTVSVVLGILGSLRLSTDRWPRFAVETVHRDVSLLVMAVLAVHILTNVLDSFVSISLTASVIPFISSYRPLWLGLGTLSFDLLIALVVTSLVRRRLGYQRWRAVHWLAYASWPVAALHGLGTGSDAKSWWMLALTAACLAVVVAAVGARIAGAETAPSRLRTPAVLLSVATPIGLAAFTMLGPLGPGWARRAGTPSSVLPKTPAAVAPVSPTTSKVAPASKAPKAFTASLTGSIKQTLPSSGGAIVDLNLRLRGGARGRLRIRLGGTPIPGGGLSMTGSQVDLITRALPTVMAGKITQLRGTDIVARVRANSGSALTLHARLHIDPQSRAVTGLLAATPASNGHP